MAKLRDPEWRHNLWQRLSLIIVFVAVALAVVGLAWGVNNAHQTKTLTQELIVSGNRHHDATAKQNSIIIDQNKQIRALLDQHSQDFAFTTQLLTELTVAGKDESLLAAYLLQSSVDQCFALKIVVPTLICVTPPTLVGVTPPTIP